MMNSFSKLEKFKNLNCKAFIMGLQLLLLVAHFEAAGVEGTKTQVDSTNTSSDTESSHSDRTYLEDVKNYLEQRINKGKKSKTFYKDDVYKRLYKYLEVKNERKLNSLDENELGYLAAKVILKYSTRGLIFTPEIRDKTHSFLRNLKFEDRDRFDKDENLKRRLLELMPEKPKQSLDTRRDCETAGGRWVSSTIFSSVGECVCDETSSLKPSFLCESHGLEHGIVFKGEKLFEATAKGNLENCENYCKNNGFSRCEHINESSFKCIDYSQSETIQKINSAIREGNIKEFAILMGKLDKFRPKASESELRQLFEQIDRDPTLHPYFIKKFLRYYSTNHSSNNDGCIDQYINKDTLEIQDDGVSAIIGKLKAENTLDPTIHYEMASDLDKSIKKTKGDPKIKKSILLFNRQLDWNETTRGMHTSVLYIDKTSSPPKCIFIDSRPDEDWQKYPYSAVTQSYEGCEFYSLQSERQKDFYSCAIFAIEDAKKIHETNLTNHVECLASIAKDNKKDDKKEDPFLGIKITTPKNLIARNKVDIGDCSASTLPGEFHMISQSVKNLKALGLLTKSKYVKKISSRVDVKSEDIQLELKNINPPLDLDDSDYDEIPFYYGSSGKGGNTRSINGLSRVRLTEYIKTFMDLCQSKRN